MILKVSKGQQITIPSEYRKLLNLKRGSKIELLKKDNKLIIQAIGDELDELFSKAMHIRPRKRMTPKQMDELVEDEILR